MPLNLVHLDAGTFRPGEPALPKPAGIIPSVLGGVAQWLLGPLGPDVAKGAHDIAFGVGDILDVPFDVLSDLPPIPILPGGAISPEFVSTWNGMTEAQRQAALDRVGDDPFRGLQILGEAARAHYEDEVAAGRLNPLHREIASPSTSFGEQIANVFALLGYPARAIERTFAGASNRDEQIAKYEGDDPFLKDLRRRLEAGDFDTGYASPRDRLLDELVANGRGYSDDGMHNLVLSVLFDPLIITSFGLGAVAKVGSAAKMRVFTPGLLTSNPAAAVDVAQRSGLFLSAFPTTERLAVMEKVVGRVAAERGGIAPAAALDLMKRSPEAGYNAMQAVAREYPEQMSKALDGLSYMQRFSLTWEPALRPITNVVRKLNDPFTAFGKGAAGKAANGYLSSSVTEGGLRAYDLDKVVGVLDNTGAASPALRGAIEQGLGVYFHNVTRWVMRRNVIRDVRRAGVREGVDPAAMVEARLSGVRGKDIASRVEMFALRVMPKYLATGKGKGAEALARARTQAAARMALMDPSVPPDVLNEIAAKMDARQVALIDAAYYGHTVKDLRSAQRAVRNAGGDVPANLDRFTIIGPRELTRSRADEIIAALDRGDDAFVRDAVQKYDLLFENLAEGGLGPDELLTQVRKLIDDHGDDLVQDVTDITGLPPEIISWAERNADLGYTLGIAPDDARRWRTVIKEGPDGQPLIESLNPWLDASDEATDIPRITQLDALRDRLFGDIRGSRIVMEARHRFAAFTTENFGMAAGEADGLFSRLMKAANDEGITPRGMSVERIWQITMTHHLADEARSGLTDRNAAEALMYAFEGRARTVGTSQKFTGVIKTGLAGKSNFVGRLAERVYPLIRFTLNPIFQLQEGIEPFVLNIARGVKPGFKPTEWDEQTLTLVQHMMRDGRYVADDMIEFGDLLLWGEIATKEGFGPTTRLGRLAHKLSIGGRLNVKRMKQTNYARLTRNRWGEEFHASIMRVAPGKWDELVAHYGTADKGMIALRFMQERSVWANADPESLRALVHAVKPHDLGARTALDLYDVSRALRQIDPDAFGGIADGPALKAAVASGAITPSDIRTTLRDFGADPVYADRAATVAAMTYTVDDWWKAYQDTFGRGNGVRTAFTRRLYQALAKAQGVSEEEYLARRFGDVPMSMDAADLANLGPTEMAAFRLQREVPRRVDELQQVAHLAAFRARTRAHTVEEAIVIDPVTGDIVDTIAGQSVETAALRGAGGGVSFDKAQQVRAVGKIVYHSHPWAPGVPGLTKAIQDLSFSSADVSFAARNRLRELRAEAPGFSYVIRPKGGGAWPAALRALDQGAVSRLIGGYMHEWDQKIGRVEPSVRAPAGHPFLSSGPAQQLAARESTDYAMRKLAKKFGFEYESTFDPFLSADEWKQAIKDIRPPVYVTGRHAVSGEMEEVTIRVPRPVGSNIAFEVEPGTGVPNRATFGSLNDIPDPQARMAITAGMEEHLRGVVENALGIKIARAMPGVGGWQGKVTPNAVWSIADGTAPDDVTSAMAMLGYLLQQDAVAGSVVRAGLDQVDRAAGQAWAMTVALPRKLTPDEIAELTAKANEVIPGIAGWGSHAVELADGTTGLRFLDFESSATTREEFIALLRGTDGDDFDERFAGALSGYDAVEFHTDVVDGLWIENNWKEAGDGEGYLAALRERDRPEAADRLVREWGPASQRRLAGLYREHAPVEWNKRIAAGGDDGDAGRLDWAAASDEAAGVTHQPRELTDAYDLLIPGGVDRSTPFSFWEQQQLKGQAIRPDILWEQDPLFVIRSLYKPTWRAKAKDPTDPLNVMNVMEFAGLTPRTNLTMTEALYSRFRSVVRPDAQSDRAGVLMRKGFNSDRLMGYLPTEVHNTQEASDELGRMRQLEAGYYRTLGDQRGMADALDEKQMARIEALAERGEKVAQDLIAKGETPYKAYRLATQSVAKDAKGVTLMARSWAADVAGDQRPLAHWFVGTKTNFRSQGTNRQWGTAVQWHNQFLTDGRMRQWLGRVPGETAVQHAFRLASVVRGLDGKTSLMAMDMLGPSGLSAGIIDTVTARLIVKDAVARGAIDDLLATITPEYRRDLEDAMAALALGQRGGRTIVGDGTRVEFETPRPESVQLVAGARKKWQAGREEEVRSAMRERLAEVFPDPDERALYDDDDIMRLIALNNDGDIVRMGGDYKVMDDYLTGMRKREADELRAKAGSTGAVPAPGESFDAWRSRMWDTPGRRRRLEWFSPRRSFSKGPDNTAVWEGGQPALYRAMSAAELAAARTSGEFRHIVGDVLYLTDDPDRVAGGAFGAFENGAIVQFKPGSVDARVAKARYASLDEVSAQSIPFGSVERVWEWDPVARAHVLPGQAVTPNLTPAQQRLLDAADELDDLSNAEYQWLRWDRERGAYEPHEIMSEGVEELPQMPDKMLSESVQALRETGFADLEPLPGIKVDPRHIVMLQKIGDRVLGATVSMDDGTRIIAATQHADVRTGFHELAHVFFPDLDPSALRVITSEFTKATGTPAFGRVSRTAEEWFADQFVAWIANGAAPTRELRPAFAYFRKWLGAIYTTVKDEEVSASFKVQRTAALHAARTTRSAAKTAQRKAQSALYRAQRKVDSTANVLRREKSRSRVEALARREADYAERVLGATEDVKAAKSAVRGAEDALSNARSRLAKASPAQKGGLSRTVRTAEVNLSVARTRAQGAEYDLQRLSKQRVEAGRAARAAKRRTPIAKWEAEHQAARDAQRKAGDDLQQAEDALKDAEREVERALAQREPKSATYRPPISDEMSAMFDNMLKPVEAPAVPQRTAFDPAHFNPEDEAVYAAAEEALLRAEDEAFRIHYYKRGRSFMERSINHPYFGLYPFSYMWGKMLPEMARFLVKTPFGVPAPFAGFEAAQQVYRGVLLQKEADPEFRDWMKDNDAAFRFGSMMLPALPWEIPVNAPLWARRIMESESMDRLRAVRGTPRRDEEGNVVTGFTPEQFGRTLSDVSTYAFGPAYAASEAGKAIGLLGDISQNVGNTVQDTLDDLFTPAQPGAFRP